MQILTNTAAMRQWRDLLAGSVSVGLVPTMGALHQGHLALIERAKAENDVVVSSIFVNPIQFNNAADFEKYPRLLEQDAALLTQQGCDVLFCPTEADMYPEKPALSLQFGVMETVMEGRFRPGHFSGVGLVVSKLFNVVLPEKAYFGQKDLQQLMIIQQMVKDLSFGVQIVPCPTVREADGLAMSSRNRRLTAAQRQQAPLLYQALCLMRDLLLAEVPLADALSQAEQFLHHSGAFRLEYLAVADLPSLRLLDQNPKADQAFAICIAAFMGEVRLIDNLLVNTDW
jgi:pantoate--beta-alanine ligase